MAKFYDPLYSRDGGPPLAFICLMESTEPEHKPGRECRWICKTARGMERHFTMVHAFGFQITLDELIKKEEEAHGGKR